MRNDEQFSDPTKPGSFLDRIPKEIGKTFTDKQIAAIKTALQPAAHSVDIRLSVPFIGGRRYIVLFIGKERRSSERRRFERLRRPLWTLMNVATIALFAIFLLYFLIGLTYIVF